MLDPVRMQVGQDCDVVEVVRRPSPELQANEGIGIDYAEPLTAHDKIHEALWLERDQGRQHVEVHRVGGPRADCDHPLQAVEVALDHVPLEEPRRHSILRQESSGLGEWHGDDDVDVPRSAYETVRVHRHAAGNGASFLTEDPEQLRRGLHELPGGHRTGYRGAAASAAPNFESSSASRRRSAMRGRSFSLAGNTGGGESNAKRMSLPMVEAASPFGVRS